MKGKYLRPAIRWPVAVESRNWYHDPKAPQRERIAHSHDMCEMIETIDLLLTEMVESLEDKP